MDFRTHIEQLINLTKPFVNRTDLIQGPGGNTSVKDENGNMLIKASGFCFSEVSLNSGFSLVSAKNIQLFFEKVKIQNKELCEKDYQEIVSQNILRDDQGNLFPKPSMETGFHAVLDKFVVHTHSVWTNLLNCNHNSLALIKQVQQILNIPIAYIPFVSPGFGLSYLISQELKQAEATKKPVLFFLENHGVIAHGKNADEVTVLLFLLDKTIADLFEIQINYYPNTRLVKTENNYQPAIEYCSEILAKYKADKDFFNLVLFPDQTVFFKNQISFTKSTPNKINVEDNFMVSYNCSEREANAIHETLTAYLFLFDTIKSKGYQHRLIKGEEVDYINNMDMEKHRKSLMN